MTKTAAIHTLGCKANQYDELIIVHSLAEAGYSIIPFTESADLYVINSCTVTHRADADSRKAARNALRRNPDAFIVMIGCYSHWAQEDISKIDGIDLILGNREKANISTFLPDPLIKRNKPEIIISFASTSSSFDDITLSTDKRSRAFLKIQDGCDQYCSYCIVPYVRGKPRSLHRNNVLHRIAELAAMGFKEIVLTGIHLGIWGREFDDKILNLVRVIDDLDGEFRIRLSSIEPMELNEDFIEAVVNSNRLCRHLHIPIQSASDTVLKMMKRPYTVSNLLQLFDKLKSTDQGWNIGTDLMTGFPAETEKYFAEGVRNLKRIPIDYYHLFTYSPRMGTSAAKLPVKIPSNAVKNRLEVLKEIDRQARKDFLSSQISKSLTFIIEQNSNIIEDIIIGLSDNYIRARMESPARTGGFVTGRLKIDQAGVVCAAYCNELKA